MTASAPFSNLLRAGWSERLLFDGGGLAFLDVVLVPGGDLGDVGAGLLDDALAAEAGVELEAGSHVEAVELEVFGFGDSLGTLLQEDVAGGAGGDASAGVVEEDAVVFGDVEEAHGLAVAVVGQGIEDELDGLVFGFEGYADDIFGGGLGEVDFGEGGAFVIGHDFSILGQKLALPKKASDGEVFIQFIPGDAYAMSHETPLGALLGGSRKEAREPHEGRAQFTTIG
jgi:hypothetical protein